MPFRAAGARRRAPILTGRLSLDAAAATGARRRARTGGAGVTRVVLGTGRAVACGRSAAAGGVVPTGTTRAAADFGKPLIAEAVDADGRRRRPRPVRARKPIAPRNAATVAAAGGSRANGTAAAFRPGFSTRSTQADSPSGLSPATGSRATAGEIAPVAAGFGRGGATRRGRRASGKTGGRHALIADSSAGRAPGGGCAAANAADRATRHSTAAPARHLGAGLAAAVGRVAANVLSASKLRRPLANKLLKVRYVRRVLPDGYRLEQGGQPLQRRGHRRGAKEGWIWSLRLIKPPPSV